MTKSANKVVVVIFFKNKEIVYYQYVKEKHTINNVKYIDIF